MMDLFKADAMALARGLTDWPLDSGRLTSLVNASDYIARFRLRPIITPADQDRLDLATFLLAVEFQENGVPAIRRQATVKKTEKALGDLKTATEYFEGSTDPYPHITALLAPLAPRTASAGFFNGMQRL
jgi:hypothetical protein